MRLEKAALAAASLGAFACIGADQGYTVAISAFTMYAAYARNGRINFMALYFNLLSILIDIVVLGVYGKMWSQAGQQFGFAMAMVIVRCCCAGMRFGVLNCLGICLSLASLLR